MKSFEYVYLNMEADHPYFSFQMQYAAKTVTCKVVMQDDAFDILFDERWMAAVKHTDEWTWIQASGVILPDGVIDEIGFRIESEYK